MPLASPARVRAQKDALRSARRRTLLLRLFVGGSGDVAAERARVPPVVDHFHRGVGDELRVDVLMWENYDTPDWRPPQTAIFDNVRFDDIDLLVDEGNVILTGKVTMPYKADAFVDLASRINGAQQVTNRIQTLPVSTFDDQLRYRIARQIYGDPLFWNLGLQVDPPLHIVVENGHVTLTGVVNSEVERRVAETIARSTFGVFSVDNKLRLDRND